MPKVTQPASSTAGAGLLVSSPCASWAASPGVGGLGEGWETNSRGSECGSPAPPPSWQPCLAALPSQLLTRRPVWAGDTAALVPAPGVSWCLQGRCRLPSTGGRAGALWVPWDDKGGPRLSILLRALLIEPTSLAYKSGDFLGSPSCRSPLPVQGSCPAGRPPAGGPAVGQPGWSGQWVVLPLEEGARVRDSGVPASCAGPHRHWGRGRLPSATVSPNRKGWFCSNRHPRRRSPGRLTGRLTLLGTRARPQPQVTA